MMMAVPASMGAVVTMSMPMMVIEQPFVFEGVEW
jgi:hypothetical protein